jgi:phosphatidylserine/phosphatidylglycerophosphate/cardiolipin synthase-like enzyme
MKYIIILIFIFLLTSCTISGNAVQPLLKETVQEPLVYFCPREDCESPFIYYINASQKSIHCALFDLDLESFLNLFEEKSKSIDVKIVVDNENWQNSFGGKGIIKDTSSQFSHNKFCIFDNQIVWTGSMNPTDNGVNKNNNNVVVISSQNLANNYELEFNELWNYNFGKGHKTIEPILYLNGKRYENYFCPEDNCKNHILDELKKAEKSIYFMIFSFTDKDIADELIIKKQKGLDVRGIVESQRTNMQYEQYKRLNSSIEIIKDKNPYVMHHKVFIIDNNTIITGSFNPSKAANEKNDENILIINNKDIAKRFLEEFDYLTSLE